MGSLCKVKKVILNLTISITLLVSELLAFVYILIYALLS